MEGRFLSTPQDNTPDSKDPPVQEQSVPANNPAPQGDAEKKAEAPGDTGDKAMNLASKSDGKKGWKGIG